MPTFIKAVPGMRNTVIYTDNEGKSFKFSGGTRTWRNNNPGNLTPGNVSHRNNQIGVAKRFAVFPDYETGRIALIDSLKNTYGDTSIDFLIERYAPDNENDTVRYGKFLHKQTGVEGDKKINDFSEDEFTKLWNAIIKFEGFKIGTITEIHKVTKVKKNRHRICELHVNDLGWKTTPQCVDLTRLSKLELVVCLSRAGNEYLRAQPNDKFQNDLHELIVNEA